MRLWNKLVCCNPTLSFFLPTRLVPWACCQTVHSHILCPIICIRNNVCVPVCISLWTAVELWTVWHLTTGFPRLLSFQYSYCWMIVRRMQTDWKKAGKLFELWGCFLTKENLSLWALIIWYSCLVSHKTLQPLLYVLENERHGGATTPAFRFYAYRVTIILIWHANTKLFTEKDWIAHCEFSFSILSGHMIECSCSFLIIETTTI